MLQPQTIQEVQQATVCSSCGGVGEPHCRLQAQWSRLILAQDVGAAAQSVASAASALSEAAGEGPAGIPSLVPGPQAGQLQLPASRGLAQAAATSSVMAGDAANTARDTGAGGRAGSLEPLADGGGGGAAGKPLAGLSGGVATSPEPSSGLKFEHAKAGSVADKAGLNGEQTGLAH